MKTKLIALYGTGQGHGGFPLAGCSLPHCDVCRFHRLHQLQAAAAQVETVDSGDRFVVRKRI